MTFIVQLHDLRAHHAALVGSKAASLADLIDDGVPVPAGFCVTTEAYHAAADDAEIRWRVRALDELDLSDAEALADAAEGLRDCLTHRDAPRGLDGEVRTAFDALGCERVAVVRARRWRTCPASRLPGSTTYLGVEAVEVVAVVRARMASLFTDRTIAYRAETGSPTRRRWRSWSSNRSTRKRPGSWATGCSPAGSSVSARWAAFARGSRR